MFEDTTLAASILSNPAAVQSLVLTEFQNRLNGKYSVADPNNTFNFLLEAASSINSQTIRSMESSFAAQYPVRATTSAELYNHMSDFDYLNMVATPSTTTLNLTFSVDHLIANAVAYPNSTYNRVIIPSGTQFYVGPLTFGIFYPINININQNTNNINVLWDTTNNNPLHELSTNMVPFVQYSNGGLNLITLTIPVSQFILSITTYPVVSQQGFIKNISYANQFYAARVFTNLPSGNWTELNYTFSETVYDPTTPTAKLIIQSDTGNFIVSIPQIYFTNNQIGNQVMVMVYTTSGAINLDLTSVEVSQCNCNFGLSDPGITRYSSILANLSTIDLTPAEKTITGGSNALTFTQLRDLVVNGGLYSGIPITPAQLNTFASKNGFSITKYIDNITDRIYYASNTIRGGQNGDIMVTTGTVEVSPSNTTTPSTIINFPNRKAVTILPTTIYSFNSLNNSCTPLTDAQATALKKKAINAKSDFAIDVNTNTYTRCPFHMVTYYSSQYPITKSFNLSSPSVNNINFVRDNVLLTPQMSVVSAIIIYNGQNASGSDGTFTLRLGVTKTTTMTKVDESNITVLVSGTSVDGAGFYGTAVLTGTAGILYIYELTITTNFYLSQQGTFQAYMPSSISGIPTWFDIQLETNLTVTFLLSTSTPTWGGVSRDINTVSGLPSPYNELLDVCQQKLDVVFGVDLSKQIYNITNALWSTLLYATYPETVYLIYPNDVYETNSMGGLVYTVTGSGSGATVNLTKIHNKGDHILDNNGNPIIQYTAGSVKYDAAGDPIVLGSRQLNYYVSGIMFDIRLFYSENSADILFVKNLPPILTSYFDTLTSMQSNLLEQTNLYYTPNNTMGTSNFSAGNNTPVSLDLGFSFNYTVYVSQATIDNLVLKSQIITDLTIITQQELSKSVISLTDIAQNAKSQLSDTIVSLDVNGIDGNRNIQTVIVPSGTTQPIIAQQLVYDSNSDTLALQLNVNVTFELAA